MAGKKNNGVVAVISDLTNEQAAQLTKEVIKYIKIRRRKSNEKNNA